ncbi:MAG: substrate-binding domain-containing protein [Victivallis sp.]
MRQLTATSTRSKNSADRTDRQDLFSGALVTLKTLKEAGLPVPDRISVIGEGERDICNRYLTPGLTVVTMDYEKLGCTAVDIVLGKTQAEHSP